MRWGFLAMKSRSKGPLARVWAHGCYSDDGEPSPRLSRISEGLWRDIGGGQCLWRACGDSPVEVPARQIILSHERDILTIVFIGTDAGTSVGAWPFLEVASCHRQVST